jgi:hypothetical protein
MHFCCPACGKKQRADHDRTACGFLQDRLKKSFLVIVIEEATVTSLLVPSLCQKTGKSNK